MRAADRLTGLLRRGDAHVSPAVPAVLLAAVLLADGALLLSRSSHAPLPPPPASAPLMSLPPVAAPSTTALGQEQREGELRLTVPALGVDADALSLRTSQNGSLEVPSTARDVGWYADGALPGDVGPAVFAGHVDLDGRAGVFSRLTTLRTGDRVEIVRPDGRPVSFVVTRVEQHAKDAFPTDAVYAPTEGPELRLVTCGGSFDRARGSYRDNVVVFAALAS